MNKKVLILSGSPRKNGNSDILCNEFARGAIEAGNAFWEKQGFILREDINYRNTALRELVRIDT